YPAFVTPLGKSIIDETDPNFGGLYVGPVTPSSETKEAIETSDVVVYAGRFPTDSNTAGWRQKLAEEGTLVILHPNYVSIGDKRYEGISFVPVVKKLVEQVKSKSASLASKAWKVVSIATPRYIGTYTNAVSNRTIPCQRSHRPSKARSSRAASGPASSTSCSKTTASSPK
ncbi:hypothetical protein KEM55_009273, partial [Ascosphaera atra]